MKAYCILNDKAIYMVGDSSVTPHHNPFFIPDFAETFTARPALAVRIGRVGKSIAPRFAHRYVEAVSAGLLIQARDLLESLQGDGLPWFRAVAFDGSAPLGVWKSVDNTSTVDYITENFKCLYGPIEAPDRIINPDEHPLVTEAIASLSNTVMLKNGDLLYIPISTEEIVLQRDTCIKISEGDETLFSIKIK